MRPKDHISPFMEGTANIFYSIFYSGAINSKLLMYSEISVKKILLYSSTKIFSGFKFPWAVGYYFY